MPFARARKRSQNSERNCVSVCTAACRAFPLSMRTLMTSLYAIWIERTRTIRHHLKTLTESLNIFVKKQLSWTQFSTYSHYYCGIINFSHLSKVWQFLLTPVKKMFKSCRKQIYNKKQKFSPLRTLLAHQIRYNKTLVAIFPTCNVWFLHLL